MGDFFGFYQNFGELARPFRLFGTMHLVYLSLTAAAIVLLFCIYKRRDAAAKRRWQRGFAWYMLFEELFYYGWVYVSCKQNVVFELLSLELCTVCLAVNISTLILKNKQVRFFSALLGLLGAPIALVYPVNVAQIYPSVCYRLINFYMTHGSIVFFSLMLLEDAELFCPARLKKHLLYSSGMLASVYLFNQLFDTSYMFIGTPPQIGIIRILYDITGKALFLPAVLVLFCGLQLLWYVGVGRLQKAIYRKK